MSCCVFFAVYHIDVFMADSMLVCYYGCHIDDFSADILLMCHFGYHLDMCVAVSY